MFLRFSFNTDWSKFLWLERASKRGRHNLQVMSFTYAWMIVLNICFFLTKTCNLSLFLGFQVYISALKMSLHDLLRIMLDQCVIHSLVALAVLFSFVEQLECEFLKTYYHATHRLSCPPFLWFSYLATVLAKLVKWISCPLLYWLWNQSWGDSISVACFLDP